jgi:hypothetical protein
MVNIPRLADEIRLRHEELNIALEDVAYELMRRALARNALMEFGPEDRARPPEAEHCESVA